MKKQYIQPATIVAEVGTQNLMAASDVALTISNDENTYSSNDFNAKPEGTDLWAEDEE